MNKRIWLPLAVSILILALAIGCKPKPQNENIMFAGTIIDIEEDGVLVETSADVGFDTALVHLGDKCKPDFTLQKGQVVQWTVLPMVTRSIPPQVTAVEAKLIADAPDNGVASVTEGLDPMPMLTPGADAGAVPPDTLASHMADMLPVLDAITRTMGIEGEQGYLPADAVFVWSVLEGLSKDWAHTVQETSLEEDTIVVPLTVMQSWALAAFNRTDALPPLPETFDERIRYDEARSAYLIQKGEEQGDSVTSIDTFSDHGDKTYDATLGFYASSGERIGGMTFALKDAPEENGAYRYVVTEAKAEPK